jgi:hypothetical protein
MSASDLVKKLTDSGTPLDVAMEVVAQAYAEGAAAAPASPRQARNRRYYAKNRDRLADERQRLKPSESDGAVKTVSDDFKTVSDAGSPSPPVPPSFSLPHPPYNYPPSPPHPAPDSPRARPAREIRGGLFEGELPDERRGWRRDWFEKEFWALYPHKVAKNAARKAAAKIERANLVDLETLLAALRRYIGKTDDRPWCNPATWLNEHRWTDEPAAVSTGPPRRSTGGNGFAAMAARFEDEDRDEHRDEHGDSEPEIIPPARR